MKIAILSDAHGNSLYFEKCISAIKCAAPDRIVFLGDCFGYMREGNDIMNRLRRIGAQVLMGNHEAMLLGNISCTADKEAVYGLNMDRKNVSSDNWEYMKKLSPMLAEEIEGKRILYVHGCPGNPLEGYLYEDDTGFCWNQVEYDFVFMGHTHRQYMKKAGRTTYVNVGSCGLPRDRGNAPGYAIYDTQAGEAGLYRIFVEIEEVESMSMDKVHPMVYACLRRGIIDGKN